MLSKKNNTKYLLVAFWFIFLCGSIYIYLFHSDLIKTGLTKVSGTSLVLAYVLFFLAGCLRGFTLIPITYLIFIGLILFPSWPLYIIIMTGVVVSSLSVYYFSEYLNFDEFFEKKYPRQIHTIKNFLSRNELPIVIFWSFAPFLPTDLICYVCGTLEVNVKKFIFGVVVGEGIACALYVFLGKELLAYVF